MQTSDTHDDAVCDAYAAACAEGRIEPPDAVFARHPTLGGEARTQIAELHRTLAAAAARTAAAGPLDRLGPYRLVERLDAGGMGTVFRAVSETDGAEVAVKVLRPELAGSPTAAERLRREAMALARLRHPNVVRVLGSGEERGTTYLVLELVRGRGMDALLAEASTRGELLAPDRVARWGAALARGLAAAHAEGVIHRDVKPSNVVVRPDDDPLLLDFGIATVPERTPGALTTSFAGSPFYAAPEQLTGAAVDGRTDVYGLCATLYQCLTGRVPFAGDRFEDVFRRALTEEPVAVRRLAPRVPRALETVVLAGLEKDPARRPASAAELADDLDAALRGGRVRARRPGVARRAVRWARARPAAAAAIAFVVLAAIGLETARRVDRERLLEEARAAVREADRRTEEYAAFGGREEGLAGSVRAREKVMLEGWRDDEHFARLDEEEGRLEELRGVRDAEFRAILSLLDRAERIDPAADGAGACRARLSLVRWRAAVAAGDSAAAEVHRSMVERADPGGPAAREVAGSATLVVVPDPPDAEVHVFRTVLRASLVPGGGRRSVAVPLHGAIAGLPPAPWALRVVEGTADLPAGAQIVRVRGEPIDALVTPGDGAAELRAAVAAGGVAATLWEDGALRDVVLPAGLDVRVSAAPLLPGPDSLAGRGETSLVLPPGEYLVLLRRPGRLDLRMCAAFEGAGRRVGRGRLPESTERPPGCVLVTPCPLDPPPVPDPDARRHYPDPSTPYWIEDREIGAGEYLSFLNDPATRAAIDASPRAEFVPRHEIDPPLWPRRADGTFGLPAGTTAEHPVLGVSLEQVRAFVAWRNAGAAARGEPWRWRLPSAEEWFLAAGAGSSRRFAFGPAFRPRWASSCFSRTEPAPEPRLAYPVDESTFGVFDMTGGAMEWVEDAYDAPRGLMRLCGGSWAQGDPRSLGVYAQHGARSDRADREFGIRLVAEPVGTENR